MFTNNSYDITRALVAERQSTLRHEARQHRLGIRGRRSRTAGRRLGDLHNPPTASRAVRETLFA